MTKEKAFELVKTAIVEHEYCDPNIITMEATIESIGMDSLDVVEVSIMIEDKLDTVFEFNLSSINTVADVVKVIESYECLI